MDTEQFEVRKRDHIQHALDLKHQASGMSGLHQVHLIHDALPELDLAEVGLGSLCLGHPIQTPFYIAGMTAGHPDASRINRDLALACAERGWAMGVGSQRRDLEEVSGSVDQWGLLRQIQTEFPDFLVFANIGISQLITAPLEKIQKLVELIDAKALAVHANSLQEAIQPEGTPHLRGAIQALRRAAESLPIPVILKETGCGFSSNTLKKLKEIPLRAIDVSGLGGTHWGRIEGARAPVGSLHSLAAGVFAGWGESTVDSVLAVRDVLPKIEIWASGGVRSGLDAAKLIALGAHRVGYAQPALEAALVGGDSLRKWMQTQEFELKVALFCTGSRSPEDLRKRENAWKPSAL